MGLAKLEAVRSEDLLYELYTNNAAANRPSGETCMTCIA
jgi:hypothetical protein